MGKLSSKRAREHKGADPKRIAAHEAAIAQTFPEGTSQELIGKFIAAATAAITNYLDLLPIGTPKPRQHLATIKQTHPSLGRRPTDTLRHGLVGDLYDAYMCVRGGDIEARGFKRTIDVVLAAGRLPLVTEREQRHIRKQIKAFANTESASEGNDTPP